MFEEVNKKSVGHMVAIWPFLMAKRPNLAFFKQFARYKMIWPFFGLF